MIFKYRSVDTTGRQLDGELQAESRREALGQLRYQGLKVTRLEEAETDTTTHKGAVGQAELVTTLSELATLLRAGVSLKDAIDSLSGGTRTQALKSTIDHWSARLRQGETFSAALTSSGVKLPDYVVQLVQAGELTGEMGASLQTAVDQLEYERQIAEEIKNALIYPAVLIASGIGAVLLVFTFVVPQFENLLDRAEELPTLAWVVLSTGKWVNANLVWVAAGLIAIALVVARVISLPTVRVRLLDGLQSIPIVGEWIIESETARWASVLSALVAHRVPIMSALDLAQNSVRLPSRQRRLSRVSVQVRSGIPLSTALRENAVITDTGYNLVRAGEKSGEVARLLRALAELHDSSGRNRMKRFLTLIEPIAILLIGGLIGVIIMGVILAITSANEIVL